MQSSLNWRSWKINLLNQLTLGTVRKLTPYIHIDSAVCTECGFYSTFDEIESKDLSRLYADYRSEAYNHEREAFEPGYIRNIAGLVGTEKEALIRVKALDQYLRDLAAISKFDINNVKNAMDWGGADGRFLPKLSQGCNKYLYEVSGIEPAPGIDRKQALSRSDNYDYIQISHVLEHISNPFEFLKEPLSHLADEGHIYLEVPLEIERPKSIIEDVLSGKVYLGVHEHINKYTAYSLARLALAHGLSVVDVTTEDIDLKLCTMKAIRLLAKKTRKMQ